MIVNIQHESREGSAWFVTDTLDVDYGTIPRGQLLSIWRQRIEMQPTAQRISMTIFLGPEVQISHGTIKDRVERQGLVSATRLHSIVVFFSNHG